MWLIQYSETLYNTHMSKEHISQCGIFAWLRIRRIRSFAVPNSWPIKGISKRIRIRLISYLKAEGLEKGVPDFLVPGPPPWLPNCPGMVIEMKTDKGVLTKEQIEWLLYFAALGWFAKVCYSEHEAIQTMIRVGY